jgi:hypothetical protein
MLIGFDALNLGVVSNTPPTANAYSKISFLGNCVVDGVHLLNYEMTDNEILDEENTEPTYTIDSIFVANFEDTLECGTLLTSIGIPLNKYIIRKKETGSSLNPTIAEITDLSQSSYVDYSSKNNTNYIYTVSPVYENLSTIIEGRGLEGGGIVSFWAWILSDTEQTPITQYVFDMQIESSEVTINKDYQVFQNYTKYPAYRFGNMEYKQLTLSTIPYRCDNNERVTDVTLLNDIITFINNGNEKVLRTPSGEAMKVITFNAKYQYNDKLAISNTQPYTITFECIEIGAVT